MNKIHSPSKTQIQVLHQMLGERLPDMPWQAVLEICSLSGVADSLQLQQHLQISSKQLRRILQIFEEVSVGVPPILSVVESPVPRPANRGRPPRIYQIGVSGAALLKLENTARARPSGLQTPPTIAHALAMTSFHLTAIRDEQEIITDRPIKFGAGRTLRVDHRIQLPGGKTLFYEIEQDASPKRVGRIMEALSNRWDFFEGADASQVYPHVRLIINLLRGRDYENTLSIWEQALGMLQVQRSAPVPFTLYAMPIQDFLGQPDWDAEPSEIWDRLHPLSPAEKLKKQIVQRQELPRLDPDQLKNDLHYLLGLSRDLRDDPPEQALKTYPIDFCYVVDLIYSVAEVSQSNKYVLERRPPLSAVMLLRAYLERHPVLKAYLKQLMEKGKRRTWWPEKDVFRHMQRVIDAFLAYHGWYNRTLFIASVYTVSDGSSTMFPYAVDVNFLPEGWQYYNPPARELDSRPPDALAWVLWALFAYGDAIGLGKPPYW